MENFNKFHEYFNRFYGAYGVYPNRYFYKYELKKAIKELKKQGKDIIYDSLLREQVRDILIK